MRGWSRTKRGGRSDSLSGTDVHPHFHVTLSHLELNKGPRIPFASGRSPSSPVSLFPITFSYIQLAWDCPRISSVTFYDPKRRQSSRKWLVVRKTFRLTIGLRVVCEDVFNYTYVFLRWRKKVNRACHLWNEPISHRYSHSHADFYYTGINLIILLFMQSINFNKLSPWNLNLIKLIVYSYFYF